MEAGATTGCGAGFRSLEEIRQARAGTHDTPVGEGVNPVSPTDQEGGISPAGSIADRLLDSDAGVAVVPDYSDSEYRFGDEWVPGGVRFRIHIGPRDRDALKEYALTRPGSRWGMLAFALVAFGMAGWLYYSGLSSDRT
jgi:hypothetical protein